MIPVMALIGLGLPVLAQTQQTRNEQVSIQVVITAGLIIVAIITAFQVLLAKWMEGRTAVRLETSKVEVKQEVKDQTVAFRLENTEQHGANVLLLREIAFRSELLMGSMMRQDKELADIRSSAAEAKVAFGRLDARLMHTDDRLFEIEKATKAAVNQANHLGGELAEHLGYSDKIAQLLYPLLPPEMKTMLEGLPAFKQRTSPRESHEQAVELDSPRARESVRGGERPDGLADSGSAGVQPVAPDSGPGDVADD
jgi:hypothetical protein